MRRAPIALVLALVASGLAVAQRQPVLKQIDLPHNYYFREMYLPQLTSGPSAVAFSPDGRTLVFSMQGSLWKQSIDSTQAEQLTGLRTAGRSRESPRTARATSTSSSARSGPRD